MILEDCFEHESICLIVFFFKLHFPLQTTLLAAMSAYQTNVSEGFSFHFVRGNQAPKNETYRYA